jgi:hypothetical protein
MTWTSRRQGAVLFARASHLVVGRLGNLRSVFGVSRDVTRRHGLLAVGFSLGALVAAGCGAAAHPAAATRGSTTTTARVVATTSTTRAVSRTSVLKRKLPAHGEPAGGPVPSGFSPVSFSAISPSQYWVLGTAPCHNPVCTSVLRTTNGGKSFVGLPAPTSPITNTGSQAGAASGVNTIRFADPVDGYAFATGTGGAFWDTHDGGAHWAQPGFLAGQELLGFGAGNSYAFALVGSCNGNGCSKVVLERSPVGTDAWSAHSVPFPAGIDPVADMAVWGPDLWISVTTPANTPNQLLAMSTDSGEQFATGSSPCFSGLGGRIEAASASVLWAVCPTGMEAQALRSVDGGAHWSGLSTGKATAGAGLANSALLAPASGTVALLEPGPNGELLRTTDGGASWAPVSFPSGAGSWFSWIGFTDASTGSALRVVPNAQGSSSYQLWRTSDGGATWSSPVNFG